MNARIHPLRACAVVVAIFALLTPSFAFAKPLDAQKLHEKILKRGIGNWVYIEERNGIALIGRITAIDDYSFSLQLENYPEATPILYNDVIRIRAGLSNKAIIALIAGTVAAAAITGVLMHNAYESSKARLPTIPAQPAFR